MINKFPGKYLYFSGASALALAAICGAPAMAQDAASEEVQAIDDEAEVSSTEERGIVVTGSRIRQTDVFSSIAPIQIIDPAIEAAKGSVDTAETIQSTPLAAGSSQITAAISSNFVTNGGQGTATVSLRGLGAERTLVLLNGRRAGPAGTRGAVGAFDLNVLPQSIVKEVVILKDGASSVYGSDAVAGVVNLITKTETDGVEFDAFMSRPFKKGGEQYRASLTYGKDFGNAHILASFDYYRREELKRGDRKYLDCPEEYIFTPEGERADLIDPRTNSYRCNDTLWGHIWLYDYIYDYQYFYGDPNNGSNLIAPNGRRIRRLQYDYAGDNLGSYIPGLTPAVDPFQLSVPPGWFPVGYDGPSASVENAFHPFISDSTVIPKTSRTTAYVEGSIQLTDNIELYAELLHNERNTSQNGYRQFWQFGFTENFVPGFGDPFSPGFDGAVLISPTTITDHADSSQRVQYTRYVGGLRGDFGNIAPSWSWDIYAQRAENRGRYTDDRIYQDSIDTQDFRTGSCVGTVTAIRQAPCIDINWTDPQFLAGILSPEERDFLFGTETGHTRYNQTNAELTATGDLFTWSGGTVRTALGLSWRRDEIRDRPGHITYALIPGGDPDDPNDYVSNAWGSTGSGLTAGHSITKEAFGELQVPIFQDQPFAKSLTFSVAGRVTNVRAVRSSDGASDKSNGNWTYRLGGNWQVNDWLRFRGSYGTSYRAPALFEQFLADQTSFLQQRSVDPCIGWGDNLDDGVITQRLADNCAADGIPSDYTGGSVSATILTGGGLGVLEPETSKSWGASVILTPRFNFLPDTDINIAVDYFNIEVNGEVAQLGAGNVVSGCYNSEFFPDDPLCSLFERGQTLDPFAIDTVRDSFVNVNSQRNEGVDVTIGITHDLGKLGTLSFSGQMTWQIKDTIALFEGTEVSTNGETGEPKWVGDFNLQWRKDDWSILYSLDVIGKTNDEQDFLDANGTLCPTSAIYGNYCVDLRAGAKFYHTASVSKKFKNFRITAGISNIFDTHPPRLSVVSGPSSFGQSIVASQYDYTGRRGFVNLTTNF